MIRLPKALTIQRAKKMNMSDAMSDVGAAKVPNRSEVSPTKRRLLLVGTWCIAFLFCINPARRNPLNPFFVPFFPLGLIEWFNPNILELYPPESGWWFFFPLGFCALAWPLYFVHGVHTLLARSRTRFYHLLLGLMLILLLNVNGCRQFMTLSQYNY